MQHRDRLPEEERKARRLEAARKYREANREKTREACRVSQAKRRAENPDVRERDRLYKLTPEYIEQQRQYRSRNRDLLGAKTREWQEANREKFKAYQKAYQVANRHREIDRARAWRKRNADRAHITAKLWRLANPHIKVLNEQRRRARIKGVGGNLSPDIHDRLMTLQRGKCAVCLTPIKPGFRHLDHIMPISKGGTNTDGNVQLPCPACNLSKSAKHPIDFMQERGFLL